VVVKYQQEFLDNVRGEVESLFQLHWEEIALNKDKIKLNPNWDAYESMESSGHLRIFTVRENGVLIGYFFAVVSVNLHYKDHLLAENDLIYIKKAHRRGFTGVNLIKFAEKCLRDDGVSIIKINTKVHKPFDKLMDYLEFDCVERVYTKYVGD